MYITKSNGSKLSMFVLADGNAKHNSSCICRLVNGGWLWYSGLARMTLNDTPYLPMCLKYIIGAIVVH